MSMINYLIVARKSSQGDDRQITSINDQVEECWKIAKRYNLNVVGVISESKSAKNPGRKGFNEMMERVDKGEVQGIITLKLNRIARNPVDGGSFIWKLQQGIIKHVQTMSQGFYPKDNLVMMYFEFGMASQFSNDLGIRISLGTAKKAMRGWNPMAKLPPGYLHQKDKKKIAEGSPEIVQDENQFSIVQSLWRELLENKCQIQELKKLGDMQGLKSIKGQLLSQSAYYRLFRNAFYCGYFHWKNEEGEIVRIQGKHVPMVSQMEFQTAQRILNRGVSSVSKTTKQDEYSSIFDCGECGSKFTSDIVNRAYCLGCKKQFSIKNCNNCPKCNTDIKDKEQFTFLYKEYYRCTKKRKKCSQPYISKKQLEQQIIAYLTTLSIDEKLYTWCIIYLEKAEPSKQDKTKEQHIKKYILELEKKLMGYTDMRAEQELTKQEYLEYSNPIKKKLETLKLECLNVEHQSIHWKQERERGLDFAQNLTETFVNGDYKTKRKILLELGSNTSILNKKAYFITPKHLLEVKKIAHNKSPEIQWVEHKKSLVKQGDLCGIVLPTSFGDATANKTEPAQKQYR